VGEDNTGKRGGVSTDIVSWYIYRNM